MKDSLISRLRRLHRQLDQQETLATCSYSGALLMAAGLCWFFPFPISRTGSVLMMVALAYMIGRFREARQSAHVAVRVHDSDSLKLDLARIDARISLLRSLVYYVPFLTGANLFWMGLPGTGTGEQKAALDCVFLAGTVLIFAAIYVMNQRMVNRQLIPLRVEIETLIREQALTPG